jgi:hypothetical protein
MHLAVKGRKYPKQKSRLKTSGAGNNRVLDRDKPAGATKKGTYCQAVGSNAALTIRRQQA